MFTTRLVALAILPILALTPAAATTVSDPVGDFLPSFTGTKSPDLDVTSFSVVLDANSNAFLLQAILAGPINPATGALYVIGVNTGLPTFAPFANIGEPNVVFNQVIVINGATGAGTVSGNAVTVTISQNAFSAIVPVWLLPSTGFTPGNYGFNLWPRVGTGNNNQISDFAPQNALLQTSPVPEPATWLTMLLGFGLTGGALRFGRRDAAHRANQL